MPRAKKKPAGDESALYRIRQFHDKSICGDYWVDANTKIMPDEYVRMTADQADPHITGEDPKLELYMGDPDDDAVIIEMGNAAPADVAGKGHADQTKAIADAEKVAEDALADAEAKDAEIAELKAKLEAAEEKAPGDGDGTAKE